MGGNAEPGAVRRHREMVENLLREPRKRLAETLGPDDVFHALSLSAQVRVIYTHCLLNGS